MKHNKTTQFFLTLLLFFAVDFLGFSEVARAQQCETVGEKIITLREPVFRTPMVWGTKYGHEGMDQVTGLVEAYKAEKEEDGFIVAGNYRKNDEDKILHPFVARLDHRGKMVWETRSPSSSDQTVHRLIKTSKGYAVLGAIKKGKKSKGFYVGRYAKNGKRIGQYPFYRSGFDLVGQSFVETKDKNGFLVAASLISRKEENKTIEAVLYRITKSGKVVWQRKYSPGMKTTFNNIQKLTDERYVVTGEIEQEDGRMGGWLMSVDESGAIGWQRQYPRGSAALLNGAVLLNNQNMLLTGVVKPLTGTKKSGWVMQIDSSGVPVWQRYYSGGYQYEAHNITVEEDGRLSVLLDAFPVPRAKKSEERPKGHVRLMTLSPRGNILNVESYADGYHARGSVFVKDKRGRRLVAGSVQDNPLDDIENAGSTMDGWVFAATMLPPYQDPCMSVGY